MPELALDDVQRHALAGELECVSVPQLMRREPPPDAGAAAIRRNSLRTAAPDHGRPRTGPSMMQNNGPTGSPVRATATAEAAPRLLNSQPGAPQDDDHR